jgi:hypothetical protein
MVFDGSTTDPMQCAFRDSLIAFMAALSQAQAEATIRITAEPAATEEGVTLDDFLAYMPSHTYIFMPTREMWPAKSVNARIAPIPLLDADAEPVTDDGKPRKMAASAWLDRNKPVEQMTWAPGQPELIRRTDAMMEWRLSVSHSPASIRTTTSRVPGLPRERRDRRGSSGS